jgi:hypothetical protein
VQASSCIQAGGLHVTQSATAYLEEKLSSAFSGADLRAYLREGTDNFELEGKRGFDGKTGRDVNIKIGGRSTNVDAIKLRYGLFPIRSERMNSFFAPWVDDIIASVKGQLCGHKVERLILIGGFGDSPYLRERFRDEFKELTLTLANDRSSEVVSDGAVIWHVSNSVTARASRFTYGVPKQCVYQSSNEMHRGRKVVKRKAGNIIEGVWDPVVRKGEVRDEKYSVQRPLWQSFASRQVDLSNMQLILFAHLEDKESDPYFVLDDKGTPCDGFTPVCAIKADMAGMEKAMKAKWSLTGRSWRLNYQVALSFGGTELRAWIVWKDRLGNEQRGPASVVSLEKPRR